MDSNSGYGHIFDFTESLVVDNGFFSSKNESDPTIFDKIYFEHSYLYFGLCFIIILRNS